MDPLSLKRSRKSGPEAKIQEAIVARLKQLDWTIMPTHGNAYQSGFPDLFAFHRRWQSRWIEVKNPINYSFTNAQRHYFPLMAAAGVGIWILTSADDAEITKLFEPANWEYYFLMRMMA